MPWHIKKYPYYETSEKYKTLLKKVGARQFPNIDYDKPLKFPAMEKHIIKTVKENPDVEFVIPLAPENSLSLKARFEKNERPVAAQKQLVRQVATLSNVSILGFEDVPLVSGNFANYRDNIHYHSGVNLWMLKQISQRKNMLTLDNIDSYLSRVLSSIKHYVPVFEYEHAIPMRSIEEQEIYKAELKKKMSTIDQLSVSG